jgi:branched-chain amino acid transport system ATP-binding protein
MLEVEDLHAGYGRIRILNGVSFGVSAGEAVGIFGHNGMGKTTLLRTLVGQLPAQQGSIRLDGRELRSEPAFRRVRAGIGYVPQGRAIFPALSVYENLRMGYIARGSEPEATVIRDVCGYFPRLEPLLARVGGTLSGGEQQLLALARALCGRPRLLLLDEPTEGIQPSIIDEILEVLRHLHQRQNLTIVLVEQSIDFIAGLSQRVLLIQKGAITREVSVDQLAAGTVGELAVG